MTPMSPTNPFEESTIPCEHDSAADARSSVQPHVEVCACTASFATVNLLRLSQRVFAKY